MRKMEKKGENGKKLEKGDRNDSILALFWTLDKYILSKYLSFLSSAVHTMHLHICISRNKRPERLIFRSNKKIPEPIKSHRFCVLPPLKNHPSNPSVLFTPPFEKSLFLVGAYFGVGVYFGKYGIRIQRSVINFKSTYFTPKVLGQMIP